MTLICLRDKEEHTLEILPHLFVIRISCSLIKKENEKGEEKNACLQRLSVMVDETQEKQRKKDLFSV